MPVPSADNLFVAIVHRIRVVVEQQQGKTLDDLAESILVNADPFRRLIEEREITPDRAFVIDVIASLAYCQGVDPIWLLTGHYDPSLHLHALSLGEERSAIGLSRVRAFVHEQFERLRVNTPPFLTLPNINASASE